MEIKVIGTGCDQCAILYKNTVQAVKLLNLNAAVEKVEDLVEIVRLGVMTVPALMVNGKVIIGGQVPKAEKIVEFLQKHEA